MQALRHGGEWKALDGQKDDAKPAESEGNRCAQQQERQQRDKDDDRFHQCAPSMISSSGKVLCPDPIKLNRALQHQAAPNRPKRGRA